MKTLSKIQNFHYKNTSVNIRYAQEKDFPQVKQLITELTFMHIAMRPDLYKISADVLPYPDFYAEIESNLVLVAEVENNIVGVLRYYKKSINSANKKAYINRNILYINSLIVDVKYRKRKIATQLLTVLKKKAINDNYDAIELQVNSKNKSALHFYRKNRFNTKAIRMEIIL